MGGRNAAALTVISMLIENAKSVMCVTKYQFTQRGGGVSVTLRKEAGGRSVAPHLIHLDVGNTKGLSGIILAHAQAISGISGQKKGVPCAPLKKESICSQKGGVPDHTLYKARNVPSFTLR